MGREGGRKGEERGDGVDEMKIGDVKMGKGEMKIRKEKIERGERKEEEISEI